MSFRVVINDERETLYSFVVSIITLWVLKSSVVAVGIVVTAERSLCDTSLCFVRTSTSNFVQPTGPCFMD